MQPCGPIDSCAQQGSAAEVLALALAGQPHIRSVGRPSVGVFSDMMEATLPNGWRFSLSHEVYRDAKGCGGRMLVRTSALTSQLQVA